MGETFRAFIAVGVPPEIAGALWEEGRAAKGAGGVRWTRPESIHLTLKFLGGIPAEKGGAVIDALGRAVEGIAPFDLEVRGLGAFPNDRAPRVVWAGLIGKLDALMGLRDAVEREVAPSGSPPRRGVLSSLDVRADQGAEAKRGLFPLAGGEAREGLRPVPGRRSSLDGKPAVARGIGVHGCGGGGVGSGELRVQS